MKNLFELVNKKLVIILAFDQIRALSLRHAQHLLVKDCSSSNQNFIDNLNGEQFQSDAEVDSIDFSKLVVERYFVPKIWINSQGQFSESIFTKVFKYVINLLLSKPSLTLNELIKCSEMHLPSGIIIEVLIVSFIIFF